MNCPNCKTTVLKILKSQCKDQYFEIDGFFDIVKCNNCNFIFTYPYLTGNNLFKYYPDIYAPYDVENSSDIIQNNNTFIRRLKNIILPDNPYYIPEDINPGNNILEIGCSHGLFLQTLMNLNKNISLTGIELNNKASEIAKKRGFEVFNKPFEDISFTKKFDYIFLWMVLEHLPYPNEVVSKFSSITNTGAKIIFSVPELNTIEFFIFGKYVRHIDIPRHLNHFTKKFLIDIFSNHGFYLEKRIKIF